MLYNDRAVQENHHVSAAYRLLQNDDEMNILSNLSKDDWRWEQAISDNIHSHSGPSVKPQYTIQTYQKMPFGIPKLLS